MCSWGGGGGREGGEGAGGRGGGVNGKTRTRENKEDINNDQFYGANSQSKRTSVKTPLKQHGCQGEEGGGVQLSYTVEYVYGNLPRHATHNNDDDDDENGHSDSSNKI